MYALKKCKIVKFKNISLIVIIATLYATLTVTFAPFAYQAIQVRLSELLTPIPFYLGVPGIFGLTLGCLVANFFSPFGILDVTVGTLGTLIGAIGSYYSKKLWQACICPILSNCIIIGLLLTFYGVPFIEGIIFVGIGEIISCFFLGYPIMKSLEKALPTIFHISE